MNFITSFLNHLFANIGSCGTISSLLHSTLTLAGTWTTSTGTDTLGSDNGDPLMSTIGTGVISLGTSVIEAADDAMNDLKHQAATIQSATAYIESLPESELDELISSLSTEEMVDLPSQSEEVKTLAKRL